MGYRFVAVLTEADRGPKVEAMEAMGAEVHVHASIAAPPVEVDGVEDDEDDDADAVGD